mmetsp:Transcript_14963/g.19589  ORF Transcript_14963/g.19589 Transcript_14963/m.19589 type:complete len:456 (-) Transcript_14963:205-1572(-)|eukprot:CAMPEP_0198146452 /NCGR_PEP_ID=MMETSP1443-20131203/29588_1 /TAXON_ID=186043 /ORGANISM="Entomoneis sp., Strain CCMP2396" /LENGTH=455 /DNA_ID=CAMNT_0043810431 /DNA_START=216 /DNA_END=1583 /DNA_ORIENTATION=+
MASETIPLDIKFDNSQNNLEEFDFHDANADAAESTPGEIWYFGYGPICHSQVRMRRGIGTSNEQAAILNDHRLSFAFGGCSTLVPSVGFTIHGVLMKMDSPEDWEKLKEFDSGGYALRELAVYPYMRGEFDLGDEEEFFESKKPVLCHAFVMLDEFDENILETDYLEEMEKKPQERYLRLIAQGMMQSGVLPDYVEDEILAVPFLPTLKEDQWHSIPNANQKRKLPKITMEKYQKMCQEMLHEEVYFILRNHVLKLNLMEHSSSSDLPMPQKNGEANGIVKNSSKTLVSGDQSVGLTSASQWNSNPVVQWMKINTHGKGDATHNLHILIVDPAVPWAPTPEDLTDLHYRWAENHFFELLSLANISAEKVYELVPGKKQRIGLGSRIGRQISSNFARLGRCHSGGLDDDKHGATAATDKKKKEQTPQETVDLDNIERDVMRQTNEKMHQQVVETKQ